MLMMLFCIHTSTQWMTAVNCKKILTPLHGGDISGTEMHFNARKCEFLRITNEKNHISLNYHINDHSIQEVTHAKYLGVMLDQHLFWNDHIKQVANKATKVNAFLNRNLYQCPPLIKPNM